MGSQSASPGRLRTAQRHHDTYSKEAGVAPLQFVCVQPPRCSGLGRRLGLITGARVPRRPAVAGLPVADVPTRTRCSACPWRASSIRALPPLPSLPPSLLPWDSAAAAPARVAWPAWPAAHWPFSNSASVRKRLLLVDNVVSFYSNICAVSFLVSNNKQGFCCSPVSDYCSAPFALIDAGNSPNQRLLSLFAGG